jgi:hypothetical protein
MSVGGATVRWKEPNRSTWSLGTLGYREPNGSWRVYSDYNGAARSLPTWRLEIKRAGPRGGAAWVPLTHTVEVQRG